MLTVSPATLPLLGTIGPNGMHMFEFTLIETNGLKLLRFPSEILHLVAPFTAIFVNESGMMI